MVYLTFVKKYYVTVTSGRHDSSFEITPDCCDIVNFNIFQSLKNTWFKGSILSISFRAVIIEYLKVNQVKRCFMIENVHRAYNFFLISNSTNVNQK